MFKGRVMDRQMILNELDQLYAQNKIEEAYQFLISQTQLAMQNQDDLLVLVLLSELIGYYRVTANFQQGQIIAQQAMRILESRGMDHSLDGATTYLNIATLYRAQGLFQEALLLYQRTQDIYEKNLNIYDERYCAFYNNVSLLYQEMGDYQKALEYELKALKIVSQLEDCEIEEAITYTNLSQMYYSLQNIDQSKQCLKKAIALFEKYNPKDPHYFAALSSLAQNNYIEGRHEEALSLYDRVLTGIENVFGKNKDYYIVLENKQKVLDEINHQTMKGMDICQKYYEAYGKTMIDEKFPDEKKYMAIGMFGFGSDCLGYDDTISRDHDFGPGFCILLPSDIYQKIGHSLQEAYNQLPQEFMGLRRIESTHGQGRVGVFETESFFEQFLYRIPSSLEEWLYVDENALLACTNGRIFED